MATVKCPSLGLDRAEVIVALSHMLHGVLAKQNLWAFSKASIFSKISDQRIVQHAAKVKDGGRVTSEVGLRASPYG